jgi:hypothetical protein
MDLMLMLPFNFGQEGYSGKYGVNLLEHLQCSGKPYTGMQKLYTVPKNCQDPTPLQLQKGIKL